MANSKGSSQSSLIKSNSLENKQFRSILHARENTFPGISRGRLYRNDYSYTSNCENSCMFIEHWVGLLEFFKKSGIFEMIF